MSCSPSEHPQIYTLPSTSDQPTESHIRATAAPPAWVLASRVPPPAHPPRRGQRDLPEIVTSLHALPSTFPWPPLALRINARIPPSSGPACAPQWVSNISHHIPIRWSLESHPCSSQPPGMLSSSSLPFLQTRLEAPLASKYWSQCGLPEGPPRPASKARGHTPRRLSSSPTPHCRWKVSPTRGVVRDCGRESLGHVDFSRWISRAQDGVWHIVGTQ